MKICVIGTRGFPEIEGGVEKQCESIYPLLNESFDVIVFRRKPYVHNNINYDNIKFIDLPSTKVQGLETIIHSLISTLYSVFFCIQI